MEKQKEIPHKLKKNLFLLFITITNILLTYYFYLSRTILERFYSAPLPMITIWAFKLCFWPLVITLVYFVKFNKHSAVHPKGYYFTIFVVEFFLVVIYFVAYLYPLIFCSSARLH